MSVKMALQMKSPARLPPQCATVSASRKPGCVMSQWSVRTGISVRNRLPGLVPLNPRSGCAARAAASSRSSVAGLTLLRSWRCRLVSRSRWRS